jgi:hypothetical protein
MSLSRVTCLSPRSADYADFTSPATPPTSDDRRDIGIITVSA